MFERFTSLHSNRAFRQNQQFATHTVPFRSTSAKKRIRQSIAFQQEWRIPLEIKFGSNSTRIGNPGIRVNRSWRVRSFVTKKSAAVEHTANR